MKISTTPDGRAILTDISWDTYECLVKNYENQSTVRLAYNDGTLEIMSPLIKHETDNRGIAAIVETILDVWEWDFVNAGSTTFKKNSEAKGFEPDTCFYLNHLEMVRGKQEIDIEKGDPAPDLVIEIDLTASSMARNPIFAAIGIPEVWRYANGKLTILTLSAGAYVEQTESVAIPRLTAQQIQDWLTALSTEKRSVWTKQIRRWAEQTVPSEH
ncbi:MAG: Uma2 family endonuclease [Capsulimonadales bacterium]|nr:Uma2 family endonuclease [Capsulimonadales bacterium]